MILEMLSFVPSAMAQEAAAPVGGAAGGLASFVPLILMLGVFYFLLIRPQHKKMKEHKALLEALRRGDKVVTGGGIYGTVSKVDVEPGVVQLEIADGVQIKVAKSAVSEVLTRTTPADKAEPEEKKKSKK